MSHAPLTPDPLTISPRPRRRTLVAALFALAFMAGLARATRWTTEPRRFAFAYLTAYTFVASIGVGSLAWLMIQHLVGAVWSVSLRRLLENLTRRSLGSRFCSCRSA